MTPYFREIDLSKTTRDGGNGLEVGPTYLVLYHGRFHVGKFNKQHYGLNFEGIYPSGCQYDPPGTNYSGWQKIWLFENAEAMSYDLEHEFAISRREYAIAHKLTSNDQTIDDSAPLEAFMYWPKCDAMPKIEKDEDEEDWC